jgi:hypothetical protein
VPIFETSINAPIDQTINRVEVFPGLHNFSRQAKFFFSFHKAFFMLAMAPKVQVTYGLRGDGGSRFDNSLLLSSTSGRIVANLSLRKSTLSRLEGISQRLHSAETDTSTAFIG